MVQIIRSVTVHRVQTRDLPRLSCGVFVWNVGKNRSCAVFEQVENGGIESGSKGLAREGMKNGPSIGVERKSQRGRERKQAKKGRNGLGFGLGKGLRSLRLTSFDLLVLGRFRCRRRDCCPPCRDRSRPGSFG